MKLNFLKKFTTEKYKLGSFDLFFDSAMEMIMNNNNISKRDSYRVLENINKDFRAAIVDDNNAFLGYIGLYDIDNLNGIVSIRLELKCNIPSCDRDKILNIYKLWVESTLNYKNIKQILCIMPDKKEIIENKIEQPNVILSSDYLVSNVDNNTFNYFSFYYKIPNLVIPCTIKYKNQLLGIIGLYNFSSHNRRANLCVYLDKSISDDIINSIICLAIDDYLDYIHHYNINNVIISVSGENHKKLQLINNTKFNYFGYIPFGSININGNLSSKFMFQHILNMNKKKSIIPNNICIKESVFDTDKKELDYVIYIDNEYKLVSPLIFSELGIDFNDIINSHADAFFNRDSFTIPLGKDKYIFQKGNDNYGFCNILKKYDYFILDKNNRYVGFANRIGKFANNRNAEIELGIRPELQNKGLGEKVLNAFYEQLFSIGYASISSTVFSFNNASIKLHDKLSSFNGVRLQSYYANNQLYDMHFYTKVNGKAKILER